MKPKKLYSELSYRERLKIQLLDNSMLGLFYKFLLKINRKKDSETIDKAKQENSRNQRVKPLKNNNTDGTTKCTEPIKEKE